MTRPAAPRYGHAGSNRSQFMSTEFLRTGYREKLPPVKNNPLFRFQGGGILNKWTGSSIEPCGTLTKVSLWKIFISANSYGHLVHLPIQITFQILLSTTYCKVSYKCLKTETLKNFVITERYFSIRRDSVNKLINTLAVCDCGYNLS